MKKKIFVILLPFISFTVLYFISVLFIRISEDIRYICPIYLYTLYQCPWCGGTRALRSLLDLDLIESLKYNPAVILLCIYISVIYIRIFINTFFREKNRQIKIIPDCKAIYAFSAGIMALYYILRNFI